MTFSPLAKHQLADFLAQYIFPLKCYRDFLYFNGGFLR